jgi:hypothetical protein
MNKINILDNKPKNNQIKKFNGVKTFVRCPLSLPEEGKKKRFFFLSNM